MITVTEKAAARLKEISEEDGIGHLTIRLKVLGGGCAGFTNDMEFNNQISDLDEVVEQHGIKVVVDPISFQYLANVTVDFIDGLMGAGFTFINPDAKGSCGCGHSFDM